MEEKLGFTPVKMGYLPENTCFDSADIYEDMQTAQIQYLYNNIMITFQIKANYTEASFAIDTQDFNVREYEKKVSDIVIKIKEYLVEHSNKNQYSAEFIYKNNYYLVTGMIEKEEFEKILKNLWI